MHVLFHITSSTTHTQVLESVDILDLIICMYNVQLTAGVSCVLIAYPLSMDQYHYLFCICRYVICITWLGELACITNIHKINLFSCVYTDSM